MRSVDEMLAETVESARRRERAEYDIIAGPAKRRLVLCGAGNLGRRVLEALRELDWEPLAFADNNPALHNESVHGLRVISPADAACEFGANAVFVVTSFHGAGDGGMASRLAQLHELGCTRVTTFLVLAWSLEGATSRPAKARSLLPYYGADLPSRLLDAKKKIRSLVSLWKDDVSRETFRTQLAWRLHAEFDAGGGTVADQYFPRDLFFLSLRERFIDGGAFDGDTLRTLGKNFTKAWAIEPDPKNVERLRLLRDVRVEVIHCALGAEKSRGSFSASGTVGSALTESGTAIVEIETIDDLMADESPTFLKLDIEGAELDALRGAVGTLVRAQPLTAICLYHRPEHFWLIPLFLVSVLPSHTHFLRAHQNDGYELVAYAIPPDRLLLR